jgi:hypothetical protein
MNSPDTPFKFKFMKSYSRFRFHDKFPNASRYVENIVTKVGFKPPPLSPIQLEMGSSRRVANFVSVQLSELVV